MSAAAQPDIKSILDAADIPKEQKAAAWDAFYGSSGQDDFKTKFDALPIPKESKAQLWDAKFSAPVEKPGFGARFAEGAGIPTDTTGAKELIGANDIDHVKTAFDQAKSGDLKGAALTLFRTQPFSPTPGVMNPTKNAAGMVSGAVKNTRQASKAFVAGDYPSAIAHAISVLPFAGSVGDAVDLIKKGDVKGGLGLLAGNATADLALGAIESGKVSPAKAAAAVKGAVTQTATKLAEPSTAKAIGGGAQALAGAASMATFHPVAVAYGAASLAKGLSRMAEASTERRAAKNVVAEPELSTGEKPPPLPVTETGEKPPALPKTETGEKPPALPGSQAPHKAVLETLEKIPSGDADVTELNNGANGALNEAALSRLQDAATSPAWDSVSQATKTRLAKAISRGSVDATEFQLKQVEQEIKRASSSVSEESADPVLDQIAQQWAKKPFAKLSTQDQQAVREVAGKIQTLQPKPPGQLTLGEQTPGTQSEPPAQPTKPASTQPPAPPEQEVIQPTASVVQERAGEPQIKPGEPTPESPAAEKTPEPKRKFSSTQVELPTDVAQKAIEAGKGIPEKELAEDGRETEPHITAKYGLHDDAPEAVKEALADEGPIKAKIGKVSIFPGEKYDVVKLDIDSPDLHRLNKKIGDSGETTDTHPTYQPHVTLAYVKPGEGKKYVGRSIPGLTGEEVTFDNLTFSPAEGEKTQIPLAKKSLQNEADVKAESLGIRKRTGLPAEQQAAADKARRELAEDPDAFIKAYRKEFGNVFGADDAAELFDHYSASENSRAKLHSSIHESSRWIRDAAFDQALKEKDSPGQVVFTSGGSASGKSTVISALSGERDSLVYDSTLNDLKGSREAIEKALAAGKDVVIAHVRRPIEDSFKANLERANSESGKGRTTNITSMVRSHRGSDEVISSLAAEYAENPRVKILAYENPRGPLKEVAVEDLKPRDYTGVDERLRDILERERPNLSEAVYKAGLGSLKQEVNRGVSEVRGPAGSTGEGLPAVRSSDKAPEPRQEEKVAQSPSIVEPPTQMGQVTAINRALHGVAKERGMGHDALSDVTKMKFGVKSMKELTVGQMKGLYKDWTGEQFDPENAGAAAQIMSDNGIPSANVAEMTPEHWKIVADATGIENPEAIQQQIVSAMKAREKQQASGKTPSKVGEPQPPLRESPLAVQQEMAPLSENPTEIRAALLSKKTMGTTAQQLAKALGNTSEKVVAGILGLNNAAKVALSEAGPRMGLMDPAFKRELADALESGDRGQVNQAITEVRKQAQRLAKIPVEAAPKLGAPIEPSAAGNTTTVYTPNETSAKVQYALVEGDQLKNSFDEGYNQELQPRNTDRKGSRERIEILKKSLNPEKMGESVNAGDGAPIILPDGTVVTRNHGTQALREMSEDKKGEYRDWLESNLGRFGIKPEDAMGMKDPVLVRRLVDSPSKDELSRFAEEANMSTTARMSSAEQAMQMAKRITPEAMEVFEPREDGTPNPEFVQAVLRDIPAQERAAFMDENGKLNQSGVRAIKNAVFAKAYPQSAAIERMAESTDSNIRNISSAMLSAAPSFTRLTEGIREGNLHDLNIGDHLARTSEILNDLRETGKPVAQWLKQENLFGRDLMVDRLAAIMTEFSRSPKRLGELLREYARSVELIGSPKQQGLFGQIKPPNRMELLNAAHEAIRERIRSERQAGNAGDLFSDGSSDTPPRGKAD